MSTCCGRCLWLTIVSLLAVRSASGEDLLFRTIDVPGAVHTALFDINDAGAAVGTYSDAAGGHAFRMEAGQFTPIAVPGARSTTALGINNAGQIVGQYVESAGRLRGFLLTGGVFTTIEVPSSSFTVANGISNSGMIVGNYQPSGESRTFGFVLSGGGFTTIDIPGADRIAAMGINDAGVVVGVYSDASGAVHGYRWAGGRLTTISFPGAQFTFPYGINDAGGIAGFATPDLSFVLPAGGFRALRAPGAVFTLAWGINNAGSVSGAYNDASGRQHGFVASVVSLLDPVPDLLSRSAVTRNREALAVKGRDVRGVAADGVSQVVIRVPASRPGDQITFALFNDRSPAALSTSADDDGALGEPGDAAFVHNRVTVNAVSTATGAFAFAVYRAPVDFARQGGQDDLHASRKVSIQLSGGQTGTVSLTVVRPPVVMIHGMWDDWSAWNRFAPLVTGPSSVDARFSIGRVSYDTRVGPLLKGTTPTYSQDVLAGARANSLGFQYNARSVHAQMGQWIKRFKDGGNPLNIPVAAVQADLVAHSMGGNIARTLPLLSTFFANVTFGQGSIHKLITIDTPHLGSPLATRLLSAEENGGCIQTLLAKRGSFAFDRVAFSSRAGDWTTGAIRDLVDSPMSPALMALRSLPTAFIAGTYTDFQSLDRSFSDLPAFFGPMITGKWRRSASSVHLRVRPCRREPAPPASAPRHPAQQAASL
jgi:uncharacterized membrane protein